MIIKRMSTGILLMLWSISATSVAAADRIVLRDLSVIQNRTVKTFDLDGIRLDDGSLVTWDRVDRGRIAENQAEFDRLLQDVGPPLFRLRRRLETGDYRRLLADARVLMPRYASRRGESAYMVCQAAMWSLLAVGRREEAVVPYLHCWVQLSAAPQKKLPLPGKRRISIDRDTGMCAELVPVWFDGMTARQVLKDVTQTISTMPSPPPEAARIYYASLAFAADQDEQGLRAIKQMPTQPPILADWRDVLLAQHAVTSGTPADAITQLENRIADMAPETKPVAIYWLGTARRMANDHDAKRQGILQLLHLPALYGDSHPQLAAAGLYQAHSVYADFGDAASADKLRDELLRSFGGTIHAKKMRNQ